MAGLLLRFRIVRDFLRGLSANWIARIGVGLAVGGLIVFLFFEILMVTGAIANPYFDLIIFMTFPPLVLLGIGLTLLGWFQYRRQQRKQGLTERALLKKRFHESYLQPRAFGTRIAWMVLGLSTVVVLFLLGATTQMLGFMEKPSFCGSACHVMNPEWTAFQDSPHRNVACVQCHVGEGMEALVESKADGLRQMINEARGVYSRPIPTPVHQLRPANETCQDCHWAKDDVGEVVKVKPRFKTDEDSTRLYNTVALRVGSGKGERGVIHWHASDDAEVRYASVGDAREEILWVETEDPEGNVQRYENQAPNVARQATGEEHTRQMDCIDCHNRVAHVFHDPAKGIDDLIADDRIDRSLPFIKAKALALTTNDYPTKEVAADRIGNGLRSFYRENYPEVSRSKTVEVDAAADALQQFYARNIHPEMNVSWKTYADHRGHDAPGLGCLRCHNRKMVNDEGQALPYDCDFCHSILADESRAPFGLQAESDVGARANTDEPETRPSGPRRHGEKAEAPIPAAD